MNKIDKNLCDAILKTIRDLSLKTVTTYYYEEKRQLADSLQAQADLLSRALDEA